MDMEQIHLKINAEDKKTIQKASQLLSLGYSTFCKQASMKEAWETIKENGEVQSQ